MAITITQDDINAVAQQVLTLIRDSGREFNNNPITFKDPFNVTEEEREGIRIPAIDERTAGQSKTGTLDLEGLLAAYGLSEVENIANTMSTSYMKKIADSDLNMNGKIITNLLTLHSNILGGVDSSKVAVIPVYTRAVLGITGSEDFSDKLRAVLKKICEDFPNCNYHIFIGRCAFDGNGTFITMINGTNSIDSEGYPTNSQGIYIRDSGRMYAVDTYNGTYSFSRVSAYDATKSALDNRINAMGSNYIRWENGLQICWGYVSYDPININTATGNIYRMDLSTTISFGQPFNARPAVTVHNDANAWVGKVNYSNTSINTVSLYGSVVSEYSVGLSYFAIGKWK